MRNTIEHMMMSNQEHSSGQASGSDPTFDQGLSEDADIKGFLERPIKVLSSTWAVGAHFTQNFNPWAEFLSNPAVVDKLNNFHLLRGNLHVTFLVNGTPQHAGLLLASYSYLGRTNETVSIGGDVQLVTRSQRPHIYINPSLSRGGCLSLPFFWGNNFLDLQNTSRDLGRINIDSFQPLTQLAGAIDAVTISVMLHMTDVVLTAPTIGMVAASSMRMVAASGKKKIKMKKHDEYSDEGPVSKVANSVAIAAGALANVPIIGPFAMATQIGSSAVASIATLFGYSKPAEIRDAMVVRPTPMFSMATADGSDMVQKLSVTRKQELTVDPRTTGLSDTEDPLAIKTLAKIESYVTQFPWTVSAAPDTWIFSIGVAPNLYRVDGKKVTPTMLSYLALPFSHWSGSIKFRFKIVASRFTRGRLAFVYEPGTSLGSTTLDTYNTNFTTIVDIAETRDFSLEIPWMQDMPYRSIDSVTSPSEWENGGSHIAIGNGVLGVRVLNELTQPDGITDISINVFASAGDDFELVNPTGDVMDTIRFQSASSPNMLASSGETEEVQDSEDVPEQTEQVVQVASPATFDELKAQIFYGERVGSLRQLAKRYCYIRTNTPDTAPVAPGFKPYHFPTFPPYRILSGGGPDEISTGVFGYNFGTTYLHYVAQMFAAWRGGMRYKFTMGSLGDRFTVNRLSDLFTGYEELPINQIIASQTSYTLTNMRLAQSGNLSGTAVSTTNAKALEVEIPYAAPHRFSKTLRNSTSSTEFYPNAGAFELLYHSDGDYELGGYDVFVAAADDFQVFGNIGAPTFWLP